MLDRARHINPAPRVTYALALAVLVLVCATTGANATVSAAEPSVATKCVVPKVKGKKVIDAEKAIVHANCGIGRVTRRRSGSIAKGHIISASPAAGTLLAAQGRVSLIVSKGR